MEQDQSNLAQSGDVNAVLDELDVRAAEELQPHPGVRRVSGALGAILRMRELSVLGAAALLFIGLSLSTRNFLDIDNLLLVARQISLLAIIATGVTFLFISQEIDLSIGSIYGFLVVLLAYLITKVGIDPWPAMAVMVIVGAGIGLANGLITTRSGIPSFIITLGMLSVLRGAALLLSGGWPILVRPPETHTWLSVTSGHAWGLIPTQVFWMAGIMLVASFVLTRTRFGAHVYATGGNQEAAILTGIPTKRVKTLCFALTGALCGIAGGLLLGQVRSGFPTTGTGYELDIIAAVVIGGTPLFGGAGSILGTLLGAAVLGMITNGLVLLGASAYFEPVAKGSIIILAMLVDIVVRRRRI